MRVLSPHLDLEAFLRRLESAASRVLMLDYDGTLAPFQVRPELALPYPGVLEALDRIAETPGTRVVIVSGRRAAEVAALLPLARRLEIWGAHGWERLSPAGALSAEQPAAEVRLALNEACARAREFLQPGARIERKPASVALHWRGLPVLLVERQRRLCETAWRPLADSGLLEWLAFDGGVELRARGVNKHHAVKAVLSETGGHGAVAYLGDDLTDEDAFRAVKGRGLAVLVRPACRDTAADLWIRPPHELLEFLARWQRPEAAS